MDVVWPKSGTYVVAVSGGVDSMALLSLLHEKNDGRWRLVVAHLDHGIRFDSRQDRELVEVTAKELGLLFVYEEALLGPRASEAKARQVRYDFLERVRQKQNAVAILTAHHKDDVLETVAINLLRGGRRKALTSLSSNEAIKRPLLQISKQELYDYAHKREMAWREDATNSDEKYLRNYVRRRLIPRLSEADRAELNALIAAQKAINQQLDTLLVKYLRQQIENDTIDRLNFRKLPHPVALEVMAMWLRVHDVRDFDRTTLERLVVNAKTAGTGRQFDVIKGRKLRVEKRHLALV